MSLTPAQKLIRKMSVEHKLTFVQKLKYFYQYKKCYKKPKYKASIKESLIEVIEEFSKFIDTLKNEVVKKDNSNNLEYIIGAILKDERTLKNDSEINNFCKCSLSVANKYLKEVIGEIKKDNKKLTDKNVLKYSDLIREYLHDVKPFVEYFKRKKDPNYILFTGGKDYNNHSYEINRISNNLYWNCFYKQNIFDQKMSINISNFALRQSLEIKFKRILGIYDVYNKSLNGPKLRHDFFPDFINRNKSHFELPYTNLSFLINAYKWTNRTIHNAENPRIWELRCVLDYVNPFFKWGEGLTNDGKKTSSIFGAVKINDYDTLKEKLIDDLYNVGSEIVTIEFIKPEAIIES